MSGTEVLNQDIENQTDGNSVIDLRQLVAGVYIVEISSGYNKMIQKLVKE